MTVLLKNLFTVHFQFDLFKLETNNTRDDKVKHTWIIARRSVVQGEDFFLNTVATSWVGLPFIRTDPQVCNLNGPPNKNNHP